MNQVLIHVRCVEELIIRGENEGEYLIVDVQDWVKNDDLLEGKNTY